MTSFVLEGLGNARDVLQSFLNRSSNIESIEKSIELMIKAFKNQGKVFSCGNGGSLCDSMHFAEELTGKFRADRPPLPAISLSDPAHMSCVANDYGHRYVFSRSIQALGQESDVLLAISTSGLSTNVIEAVSTAQSMGISTVGLMGKGGGELKDMVDIAFVIESAVTERIQEMHIKIIHLLIEGVERKLFPQNYTE